MFLFSLETPETAF